MPNEMSAVESLMNLQDEIAMAKSKAKDQATIDLIDKNTKPMLDSYDMNVFADAAQLRDKQNEMSEGKSMGGMMQYNMGGSMLMPPEREGYLVGSAVKVGSKLLKEAKKHVDDLKTKPTDGQDKVRDMTLAQRAARETQRKTGAVTGAGTLALIGGANLLSDDSDTSTETKESEVPVYAIKDLPTEGAIIVESNKGETTYKNPKLKKELKKAIKNNETEVMYDDEIFNTESLEQAFKDFDGRTKKMYGGKMKYAEGSMLMPPEMGMPAEQEMPVDTYDNIPEDEKAEAEASQLPDAKMEDNYLEYVLNESLDQEDQEYLMTVLEGDERLSGIFDKVMDVAGEFSGEGEVNGPGTGVSDSIPARLSDGEFVITEKATDQIGADNLQKMMDEAEMAYDGGYMKKAFGGLTLDPMQDEKQMYGMEQMKSTQNELRKQMLGANRMPSVLQ